MRETRQNQNLGRRKMMSLGPYASFIVTSYALVTAVVMIRISTTAVTSA